MIRICRPTDVYEFLRNPSTYTESGEEWRVEEGTGRQKIHWGFSPVLLKSPLKMLGGYVSRQGDYYKGHIWILSGSNSAFKGVSQCLEERLGKAGYEFEKVSDFGEGYIRRQGEEDYSGVIVNPKKRNIVVAVGDNGLMERICENPEEFSELISELELFTNLFIDSCYSLHETNPLRGDLFLSG